jgi:hypothetical protein
MDVRKAMRDLVTSGELAELTVNFHGLSDEPIRQSNGEDAEVGNKLIEQAFRHWQQTVHDLQKEVRELKRRIEELEHMHEEGRASLIATGFEKREVKPQPVVETTLELERPTRLEKHKSKGRWF